MGALADLIEPQKKSALQSLVGGTAPKSALQSLITKPASSGIAGSYKALWTAIGDFAKPETAESMQGGMLAEATTPEIAASATNLAKLPVSLAHGIGEQIYSFGEALAKGNLSDAGRIASDALAGLVPGQYAVKAMTTLIPDAVAEKIPGGLAEKKKNQEELRGMEWMPALDALAVGHMATPKPSVGRLAFETEGMPEKLSKEMDVNKIRRRAEAQPLALEGPTVGEGFTMRPPRPGEAAPDTGPAGKTTIESAAVEKPIPTGVRKIRFVKSKNKFVAFDKDGKSLAVYDDLAAVPEVLRDKLDVKSRSALGDLLDQPVAEEPTNPVEMPDFAKGKKAAPLWVKGESGDFELTAPEPSKDMTISDYHRSILSDELDRLRRDLGQNADEVDYSLAEYDKLSDEQKRKLGRPIAGYDSGNLIRITEAEYKRMNDSEKAKVTRDPLDTEAKYYLGPNKVYVVGEDVPGPDKVSTGEEGLKFIADKKTMKNTMDVRHEITALERAVNGEPLTEAQAKRVQYHIDKDIESQMEQVNAAKQAGTYEAQINNEPIETREAKIKSNDPFAIKMEAGSLTDGSKVEIEGEWMDVQHEGGQIIVKDGKTYRLKPHDVVEAGGVREADIADTPTEKPQGVVGRVGDKTVTFASEMQKELYDAGMAIVKSNAGGNKKAVNELLKSVAERYGLEDKQAVSFAMKTLRWVRERADKGETSIEADPAIEPKLGIDKTEAGDQVSFGGQRVVPETPIAKVGRRVKDVKEQGDVFSPEKIAGGKQGSIELGFLGTPQAAIDLGQNVVKGMKSVSDATTKAVKEKVADLTESGGVGGDIAREKMIEHHANWRDLQFQLDSMGRIYKNVVSKDRWQLVWDATQQYGRSDLQAKLTPAEKAMSQWLGSEFDKMKTVVDRLGGQTAKLPEGVRWMPQIWENPKTGEAYSSGYGKFSGASPRLRGRSRTATGEIKYPHAEAGRAAGLVQAETNIGKAAGDAWKSLLGAEKTRELIGTLKSIESEPNATVIPSRGKARTARIVEDWATLKDNGLTEDYVRATDIPIPNWKYVGQAGEGQLGRLLNADVGVHKSVWPWVRDYMEAPAYDTAYKIASYVKNWKLGLSLFHPFGLALQDTALRGVKAPYDWTVGVYKGLKALESGDEVQRILHKNGLETHKFADIGIEDNQRGGIRFPGDNTKIGKPISAVLNAPYTFTFEIFQPGLKNYTARVAYMNDLEKGLAKGMSKDEIARAVVKNTDRLFSGEDWRRNMLEGSRFMAEWYYSPKARANWQKYLISPTWQKAHFGIALKDIPKSMANIAKGEGKPADVRNMQYLGGAIGLYVSANLYNQAMTKHMDGDGKWMWENPSGYTVRAPWNDPDGRAVYFRPFKSIFEVPEAFTDLMHGEFKKVVSKLNPMVTQGAEALTDVVKGKTGEAVKTASEALLPIAVSSSSRSDQALPSRVAGFVGVPVSKGRPTNKGYAALWDIRDQVTEFRKKKGFKEEEYSGDYVKSDKARLFDAIVADDEKTIKELIKSIPKDDFVAYIRGKNPLNRIKGKETDPLEREFSRSIGAEGRAKLATTKWFLGQMEAKYERLRDKP